MRNSVPPVYLPSQVLVLEDDADVRGALFAALRLEGCSTRTSETQSLGCEEALVDRPGVIVFEYALPWTRAHAIVEQLRLLMRPAPSLILLSDPASVVAACAAHGIGVFPMHPPQIEEPAGASSRRLTSSILPAARVTRVLTIDCPDHAQRFLETIQAVPKSSDDALLIVRNARSGLRMKAVSIVPPAAASSR